MSVLVAVKDRDRIWIGCDSQVTGGMKGTLGVGRKLWKVGGEEHLVLGVVGHLRDADILSTAEGWITDSAKLKDKVDFKYIVRSVVPKIFSELSSFGRLNIKDSIQSMDSILLFAYKDSAYLISPNGAVNEMGVYGENILVAGSGEEIALGVWNGLKDSELDIEDKLYQTLATSCEHDPYVGFPIHIINTLDNRVITTKR